MREVSEISRQMSRRRSVRVCARLGEPGERTCVQAQRTGAVRVEEVEGLADLLLLLLRELKLGGLLRRRLAGARGGRPAAGKAAV
jgi:hypothetical protein